MICDATRGPLRCWLGAGHALPDHWDRNVSAYWRPGRTHIPTVSELRRQRDLLDKLIAGVTRELSEADASLLG